MVPVYLRTGEMQNVPESWRRISEVGTAIYPGPHLREKHISNPMGYAQGGNRQG